MRELEDLFVHLEQAPPTFQTGQITVLMKQQEACVMMSTKRNYSI